MKILFLILFPFFSFAQASTYEKGDSTWLTSADTGMAKVYKVDNPLKALETPFHCLFSNDKSKYDTIGPVWKQVSDTGPGYNPVMAMQMYEVRERVVYLSMIGPNVVSMLHFTWLDIKKKPFKFKVW